MYHQDRAGAAYRMGGAAVDATLFAGPSLAGPAVEAGAVMFGPKLAGWAESYGVKTGLIANMAESGQVLSSASPIAGSAGAIRETILANIAESQASNASSQFGRFVSREGLVQENVSAWPPNRGRIGPVATTELQPGYLVDRYGSTRGTFVAPDGASFASRALPSYYESSVPYFRYEVVKSIPDAVQSRTLRWFGQSGMGTQYELAKPVQWYLDNGYLKVK
jgi:hypothetical protein